VKIDFPNHQLGPWLIVPVWRFWKGHIRRKHWRWIVDHRGCQCMWYWEYR